MNGSVVFHCESANIFCPIFLSILAYLHHHFYDSTIKSFDLTVSLRVICGCCMFLCLGDAIEFIAYIFVGKLSSTISDNTLGAAIKTNPILPYSFGNSLCVLLSNWYPDCPFCCVVSNSEKIFETLMSNRT